MYRTMRVLVIFFVSGSMWSIPVSSPQAVFSGDMSPRAESGDSDYAAAVRAKNIKDWPGVIENLKKVLDRRPWHDNGHTLMGYAHRQIENYETALEHYNAALDHNPRHRGALEYMGVTYLHMGDLHRAQATLDRLWRICGSTALTFSDGEFGTGCEEWEMLDTIISTYKETGDIIDCE